MPSMCVHKTIWVWGSVSVRSQDAVGILIKDITRPGEAFLKLPYPTVSFSLLKDNYRYL